MICPYCMKNNIDGSHFCSDCGQSLDVQNENHQLPVGTMLQNRYYVGAVIRQGGFGITYHGCDMRLNKKIAIKEYFPSGLVYRLSENSIDITVSAGDRSITYNKEKNRFTEEAKILAEFSKERNIVNVEDIFSENNTTYIVMEFIDGMDLDEYIRCHPKLSFKEAFKMIEPIIRTLDNVHARGLIHRDISPANIKVLPDGDAILLDFGAAREYREEEKSYSMILKPGYAPCEQYLSRGIQGPSTDVYAICATLYKMITGVTPENSIDRMADDVLKKPSELGADISGHEENVLMKGMAVMARDRIQSMSALLDALTHEESAAHSTPKDEKKTKFLNIDSITVAIVICTVVVAIAGLAFISISKKREHNSSSFGSTFDQTFDDIIDYNYGTVEEEAPTAQTWDSIDESDNTRSASEYYNEGMLKEESGDYEGAIQAYEKAVDLQDVDSMFCLGNLYMKGIGCEADYDKAEELLKQAAALGNADAMNALGYMFDCGLGREADKEEAFNWYMKSALLGSDDGCNNVGSMYLNGDGVEQDYDKALEWLQKGADLGDATAKLELGVMYLKGLGVKVDYVMAMDYFTQAVEQNNAVAMNNIGYMYEKGLGVKQDYQKAFEWYQKGADLDDPSALNNLGKLYRNGTGVEKDYNKYINLVQRSADLNNPSAQLEMGYAYNMGYGVEVDYQKAMEWYLKAAEQGNATAMNNIAVLYANGDGVPADQQKADEWYKKAEEYGAE